MKRHWAIRVEERARDRLVIVDPPDYWAGGLLVTLGACVAGAALADRLLSSPYGIPQWIWMLLYSPLLVLGMAMFIGVSKMTMDRRTGRFLREWICAGLRMWRTETAIDNIRHAEVDFYSGRPRLMLVLQNGGTTAIIRSRGRSGHRAVAQAINDFLAGR